MRPLLSLLALPGSFTPSMANMCLPINPIRSSVISTWLNRLVTSPPSSRTKRATWLKLGRLSPLIAMNTTFCSQACAILRLLINPRL